MATSPQQQSQVLEQLSKDYDQSQTAQLLDMMTLVDENDNVIGSISKLQGHLRACRIKNEIYPHRAFSLFLFNTQNELLLQKRSPKKITFPALWTNTCCSHPSHIPEELDNSPPDYLGIKRAAIRRAKFELGIEDLKIEDLSVVSRILYFAEQCERFQEYELDYIVFAKKDIEGSADRFNRDEIEDVKYVSLQDFDGFLEEQKNKYNSGITPWFKLLRESKLKQWWGNLIEKNQFPNEAHFIERFV